MAKKTVLQETYPAFVKTTLPNGIRVVSETIPSVRSVSVGVWVFTGSRDEPAPDSGICHFIEHMVFKGTRRRRMHQIAQRMEAVGGYLNAFTSKEYTCYYARALDEHLDRAIDTVVDLVAAPNFPEKELEKEKDVVLEEMKMYEDSPEDLAFDKFETLVYHDHALGRPVIGTAESVSAFTREQLVAYMDEHYTPNRIVVAAAGNVRHERLIKLVERAFAETERSAAPVERTPVDGYAPRHLVDERPIQQAHLILGTRCPGIYDDRRVALTVLNTILGGGMSSRLNQNIREKYGYCYSIYSFVNMHSDAGDFGVYMGTDAAKVERAKKLILRELEKVAAAPVSERALARAKNQVKGSIMMGLESMSNRMMRIGRQEIYFDQYFTLDEIIAEVEAVSREDVHAIAQELIAPDAFSSVVLLPS